MDIIDLDRAAELGIKVKNSVGTNSISVAELTIALMFTMARKIPLHTAEVKNGGWARSIGFELTGKKLGLIGWPDRTWKLQKELVVFKWRSMIYDPGSKMTAS